MKSISLFILLAIFSISIQAQDNPTEQQLDTVVIASTRIDLPFKENSRTITVISASDIKNSAATNVADLLQQVAGVDIIRSTKGPLLLEVNSSPGLEGIEGATEKDIAGTMIASIEKALRWKKAG